MQMGRRSEFTPAQKRGAVPAGLTRRKALSEVCGELGVSERSFARWREKAQSVMEQALADKEERSGLAGRREAEVAEDVTLDVVPSRVHLGRPRNRFNH